MVMMVTTTRIGGCGQVSIASSPRTVTSSYPPNFCLHLEREGLGRRRIKRQRDADVSSSDGPG